MNEIAFSESTLHRIATWFVIFKPASSGPMRFSSLPVRDTSAYARFGSKSCDSTPFQYVSCPEGIDAQCQYSIMFAPFERCVYTSSRSCPSYGGYWKADVQSVLCAFVSVMR